MSFYGYHKAYRIGHRNEQDQLPIQLEKISAGYHDPKFTRQLFNKQRIATGARLCSTPAWTQLYHPMTWMCRRLNLSYR